MHETGHSLANPKAPPWLRGPFNVFLQRRDDESTVLHSAMKGLVHLEGLPQYYEQALESVQSRKRKKAITARLTTAREDAQSIRLEVGLGFPVLHAHSTIGIWSAIETLTEDLAFAWISNAEGAWSCPEVERIKIPLSAFRTLPERERIRHVLAELSRSVGADFKKGAGKLSTLLGVFDLRPEIGPLARQALHELAYVRNLLVHCSGVADAQFLECCKAFDVEVGGKITVPHELWSWYAAAASAYADRLATRAIGKLGLQGCECEGAGEVIPRSELKL